MEQHKVCRVVDPIKGPDGRPHQPLRKRVATREEPLARWPPPCDVLHPGEKANDEIAPAQQIARASAEKFIEKLIVFVKPLAPTHAARLSRVARCGKPLGIVECAARLRAE